MRTYQYESELWRRRDNPTRFNSRGAGTLLRTQVGGFADSMQAAFFG